MKINYYLKRFSLLALLFVNYSAFSCNFQLKLADSYGDGWNGGKVTVKVNGTSVLIDKTIANGFGPVLFSFTVNTGDLITTDYTEGSYGYENEYWILDALGNEIANEGAAGNTPGDITTAISAVCPPPIDLSVSNWIGPANGFSPSAAANIIVEVTNSGTTTQTGFNLSYSIDNGATFVTENYSGTLASGATYSHAFSTTANMSTGGNYHCVAVVSDTGDAIPSNDTLFEDIYLCTTLSGTYTVGPGAVDDFNTIQGAIDALNLCGVSGAVIFEIDTGTYEEQLEFLAVTGASATNTITFKSATGNASDVIITNDLVTLSTNYTIKLNGADYFRFENLSIEAMHWQFANVIDLTNNASYNTFYGNNIKSAGNGSDSKAIHDYGSFNNNFNTYRKNKIEGSKYAFYLRGKGNTNRTQGTQIDSNDIAYFFNSGMQIYYQDSIIISNNYVHDGGSDVAFGMELTYLYHGFKVTNNKIVMNLATTSTGLRLYYGNYYSYATAQTLPGLVANNMISMISSTNSNTSKKGLHSHSNDSVMFYNNTVLIESSDQYSSALIQQNTSSNIHGCKYINNNLVNLAGGYACRYQTPSSTSTISNNNYFSTGNNFVYWNGNKTDIAALQAASGKDVNSISLNPGFFANDDLHILSNALDGSGVNLPEVLTDFDNETRSATPDIGADEFTLFAKDVSVKAWISPVDTVSLAGNSTISILVRNMGSIAQTNIPVKYSIDNGQTFVSATLLGTLLPDSQVVYNFATLANFSTFGITHCMALTNLTGEMNAANDTVFTDVFACSPLNGVYTLGTSSTNDFTSLQQLSMVLEHCGVSGAVTVNVQPGVYDGKGKFKEVYGASLANTITIQGSGNQTKFINTSASEYNQDIFEFDEAKFFILDSLLLSKTLKSKYYRGVWFHNQSDSNIVRNCILDIAKAKDGIVGTWSSYESHSGGNNGSGIIIENNIFMGGSQAIKLSGNNYMDYCTDNHILNNTVNGGSIELVYQKGAEIIGNIVVGSNGTSTGISANTCKDGLIIKDNYIDVYQAWEALNIDYYNGYGTISDTALISNNVVINEAVPGGVSTTGINVENSKYVNVINNSVSSTGGSTYSKTLWIHGSGNLGLEFTNNIFANYADGYAIYATAANTIFENDYNQLFSTGADLTYIGSTGQTNLAAWKTASADAVNSVEVNPYYFTDHDLRSIAPNNYGNPVPEVVLDINGVTRSTTTPDVGAFEYSFTLVVDLGADTSLCEGTTLPLLVTANTDYTGFNYVWVNAITGDTLSTTGNTLEVDSTGTYAVNVAHPSGYSASDTIVVTSSIVVDFNGLYASYCEDDYPSTLLPTPTGGVFSGTGITGAIFNPITAGLGNHDISYTYTDVSTSCTVEIIKSTTVNPNPVLSISADTAICVGDSVTIFATDTAVANHTYFWTNGDTMFSTSVSPSLTSAFYATINDGTCTAIDSVVVTVNALPTPTFTGLSATYCQNDPASILVGSPAGGVYSGSGVSGNTYTPSFTGTQLVNYLYTDAVTTCSNTYTGYTLVNSLPNNSILGLDTSYCVDDTAVSLNFYPSADSISGTGIIQPNVFNPTLASVGSHEIIFIYTDVNSCSNADTTTVTVHGLPAVTLTGLDANYCLDDANDTLVGLPVGGYYIGPGAYPEIFEPSIVGIGNHDIIYVYPDVFGCVNSDTVSTTVHGLPTVTLPNDTSICADNSLVLDAGSFVGYSWNTGESTQTISVDTTGNGTGTSNFSVVVSDQNTCEGTDSITITFEAMPVSILEDTATICGLGNEILLTASNNPSFDFTWSTGSSGAAIFVNTADLGGATGYVSVSIATLTGCTTYDSVYVYFREIPIPIIGNDTIICWNKTIVLDAGSGFTSYQWNTGATTQTITIDSLDFSLGGNQYMVEVENAEQCTNGDTINVEVDICTGIITPALTSELISVYPNPSNGQFKVSISGLKNQQYYLGVYNTVGALVFEKEFENHGTKIQTLELDLSSQAKGVYFIQLQSEGKIQVERLIIQ